MFYSCNRITQKQDSINRLFFSELDEKALAPNILKTLLASYDLLCSIPYGGSWSFSITKEEIVFWV